MSRHVPLSVMLNHMLDRLREKERVVSVSEVEYGEERQLLLALINRKWELETRQIQIGDTKRAYSSLYCSTVERDM